MPACGTRNTSGGFAVVGTYEGTREFAYAIMQSDTLMNMSQVRWEVSHPGRLFAKAEIRMAGQQLLEGHPGLEARE